MRLLQTLSVFSFAFVLPLVAAAPTLAEVKVSKSDAALPADALSEAVAARMQKTGYKVTDGEKTICEFWLCETWTAVPGFQPTATVLYPLEPGTLVGVIRLPSSGGSDFRQQELQAGVYTLRYGHQPQDGNHVGTSETLDFLLLSNATEDQAAAAVDAETLIQQSAMAAGSTHPAMMALRPAVTKLDKLPVMQRDEVHDWTSVRVAGVCVAGDKKSDQQLEFVVVGFADE
ncbi:MAG: hypothetical protein MPJ50_02725 [Pirellulales bacterium]|nr:hypothetical protein [Pirellulales bacterium]